MRRARWIVKPKPEPQKPVIYHCISRVVNRDFVFETSEPSELDCPQGSPEGGGGDRHQKEQLRMFMPTRQLPLEQLRRGGGRWQQGQ
jgi:hypothetical protein